MQNKPQYLNGWETDENGRRYRMNGGIREYEMLIRLNGAEIPQSELSAYHEQRKAAEQARIEAEKNKPTPPPQKICPFASGLTTQCDREKCALYVNGCILSDKAPTKATAGKHCPFNTYHICREDCALFIDTGCTLTAIKQKARKSNNDEI